MAGEPQDIFRRAGLHYGKDGVDEVSLGEGSKRADRPNNLRTELLTIIE